MVVALTRVLGQTPQPSNLTALEENVAKQFNQLRVDAGLKPLTFRRDLRVRMEACSVQLNGPDSLVENVPWKRKQWYLAADPSKPDSELPQITAAMTTARWQRGHDHVAVGVWFATTDAYPAGMYWVVVYPEHSEGYEGFWSHFYLTDGYQYMTRFDKYWKARLPQLCRSIK
jgi:hypothetical protein